MSVVEARAVVVEMIPYRSVFRNALEKIIAVCDLYIQAVLKSCMTFGMTVTPLIGHIEKQSRIQVNRRRDWPLTSNHTIPDPHLRSSSRAPLVGQCTPSGRPYNCERQLISVRRAVGLPCPKSFSRQRALLATALAPNPSGLTLARGCN